MNIEKMSITLEKAKAADVDSVVKDVSNKAGLEYRAVFDSAIKKPETTGESIKGIYCLMSSIFSMHFKPSDPKEPYGPMFWVFQFFS